MNKHLELDSDNEQLDIKVIVYKYLAYWHWIALCAIVAVALAFLYLRYTPNSYTTTAKVKILTDKEAADFALDLDKLLGKGNINLENERAVLQSFRLNNKVVKQLNLQVAYFQTGRINQSQVFNAPFTVVHVPQNEKPTSALNFEITVTDRGYKLVNLETEEALDVPTFYFDNPTAAFPFKITPNEAHNVSEDNPVYTMSIATENKATQSLVNNINVSPDGKDSDILILSLKVQIF